MSYKCLNCGHIFDDGEEVKSYDFVGEAWGRRIYEETYCCPSCGERGFEETFRCKKCNGSFIKDELVGGYCEDCIKDMISDYKYRVADCYRISQKNNITAEIEIDGFLACMFTPQQINEVLYKEIVSSTAIAPVDCTPFIEDDESWFADIIIEEVNKN